MGGTTLFCLREGFGTFRLRGLEQIGKALLLLDGEDPRTLTNSEKSLIRLLLDFPFYENLSESKIPQYVQGLLDDLECALQAETVDLGDELTWIDPSCKFREEEFVAELFHSIRLFLGNKYTSNELDDAFNEADPVCSLCYDPRNDLVVPSEPCQRHGP